MTEIIPFEKKMYGEYLIEVTYEFEGQSCIKFENGVIDVVRSSELDDITHTINSEDVMFLNWLYEYLKRTHVESVNIDYMIRFDGILKGLRR